MVYQKIIAYFFSIFLLCCYSLPAAAQNVYFDEAFTIGREESDSTEYLFSGPKEITTDDRGRVYIADGSSNSIKIFDQKGHYLTSVGRRGRGPGEYQSIDHMSMDNDNNLYVLDRLASRVTMVPGTLEDSQTFIIRAKFSDPFALYPLQSGNHLIFATGVLGPSNNPELAYIFDHEFKTIKKNFLLANPSLFESDEKLIQMIRSSPFYDSTLFGGGKIALCHENFGGKIAIINPKNKTEPFYTIGEWDPRNFTLLDYDKREQYRDSDLRGLETTSRGGGMAFQTTSNMGLVGNSNYLVHFYAPLKDNVRISTVRVYNNEGKLLLTKKLNGTDLNLYQENGRSGLKPKHMDEDNKIYFADYTGGMGIPVVRVVKMFVK